MSQIQDNSEEQKPKYITFEDGIVQLGGEEVPGILRTLTVDGKVRFDEQKVDGASSKKKTPQGFEDTDVMLGLVLITDDDSDCYEKLEKVSGMFRAVDDKANPKIYNVANRHLLARGVSQVVFSKLQSAENDKTDEITVTLGFVEHNPPIVKTEKQQAKTPTPSELKEQAEKKANSSASSATPTASEDVLNISTD